MSMVIMISLVKLLTAPYKVTELCLTVFVCLLIGALAFIHVFLIAFFAHKFVYNSKVVRMLMLRLVSLKIANLRVLRRPTR